MNTTTFTKRITILALALSLILATTMPFLAEASLTEAQKAKLSAMVAADNTPSSLLEIISYVYKAYNGGSSAPAGTGLGWTGVPSTYVAPVYKPALYTPGGTPSNTTGNTNVNTNGSGSGSAGSAPTLSANTTLVNEGDKATLTYNTNGQTGCLLLHFGEEHLQYNDSYDTGGSGSWVNKIEGQQEAWAPSAWRLRCDGGVSSNLVEIGVDSSGDQPTYKAPESGLDGISVSVDKGTAKVGDTVTISYDPGQNRSCRIYINSVKDNSLIKYIDSISEKTTPGTQTWKVTESAIIKYGCLRTSVQTSVIVE